MTQSPGVARHFDIDGVPQVFRGTLKDLSIRVGWSNPLFVDGKILAEITMRRSDHSRTFHLAQDELVADGGTKIFFIRAVADPELQSRYSWRVYASSVGLRYSLYGLAVEDE